MARRVLIIGLDSASLPWVEKWVGEGKLPNLGRWMDKGATGILRTVTPPLSPAAWSSFATGTFPGKHGVFDHIYRRPGTYELAPTNAKLRAGVPLWQLISQYGGKAGVINVPETYPPMPLNGFMLSGMDTPSDEAEFAYPPTLKTELQQAIGGYKVFGLRSKENLDRSIAGMRLTIPMRARAGQYLWETYRPDFMILVFMETDVIQHKCWKYLDPSHPEHDLSATRANQTVYKETIPEIYSLVDASLGPWLDTLDENTTVMIMSDHGAGPLVKFLHLNNWLIREGYLRFKTSALARLKHIAFRLGFTPANVFDLVSKLGLGIVDRSTDKIKREMAGKEQTTPLQRIFLSWSDVDWSQTRAYALGGNFTGFYLNVRGREPHGCVNPGQEYETLREELAARLTTWKDLDTGETVVERVLYREELYQGPFAMRAPDLVFITKGEAYTGHGGHEFASNHLMATSPVFNGHHRMEGMITIAGEGVRVGRLASHQIVDVAPTVLYLLGYPIPADMDGEVIQQAFHPNFLDAHPIQIGPPVNVIKVGEQEEINESEDQALLERLADLGYL